MKFEDFWNSEDGKEIMEMCIHLQDREDMKTMAKAVWNTAKAKNSEWQPVETAPEDFNILVCTTDGYMEFCNKMVFDGKVEFITEYDEEISNVKYWKIVSDPEF